MTKTIIKVYLLFCFSSMGAVLLVLIAYSNGLLSPRGLGIALVVLGFAIVILGAITARKLANRSKILRPPSDRVDENTRRRRLLGIRMAKVAILMLVLSLIFGLFHRGPLIPTLVGVAVNLCIIAAIIQLIVRLQRSLH